MTSRSFIQPIVGALALALRWPSLAAWAALVALAMGARAVQAQMVDDVGIRNLALVSLAVRIGTSLVTAVIAFVLSRALLAPQTGHARPLYLRFIGLFLLMGLINVLVATAGRLAIFSGEPSQWMMTYGSVLVGSIGSIAVFPLFVRMIATAAGAEEPRLGRTWALAFDEAFFAYAWYAICVVVFPVLMVFTFANLLPQGDQANALPGNVVQSVITGTGGLLQYLIAIIVAQWAIPGWRHEAEAFA